MCILAFSSIYSIQLIGKSFLFNFCENFVFFKLKRALHKAWFENIRSPPQESRGQNENRCGEHGGCVRFVLSENRFATVAQWPRISFATGKTVSPLAMWRMVSATPASFDNFWSFDKLQIYLINYMSKGCLFPYHEYDIAVIRNR